MITREKGSRITDEFLEAFGKLYHAFKYFGVTPNEICHVFTVILGVSKSSYLTYLRRAREKGFVTDSYEQNREELVKRSRGEGNVVDPEIKALIFSYIGEEKSKKNKRTVRRKKTK